MLVASRPKHSDWLRWMKCSVRRMMNSPSIFSIYLRSFTAVAYCSALDVKIHVVKSMLKDIMVERRDGLSFVGDLSVHEYLAHKRGRS